MGKWRALWRRLHQTAGDRGSFTLELAIIAPAVFLLLFGTIQAGLYFHARETAHRAARQGVEAGRAYDAGPQQGVKAARSFLGRMGRSVDDPHVSADGSTTEYVRISVTGTVVTLVPGLTLDVTARAQAPVEKWTP